MVLSAFMNRKNFDLVLSNPPYGMHSAIAKKVISNLIQFTDNLTVLSPQNTYKSPKINKYLDTLIHVDNCFDASIDRLTIGSLSKYVNKEWSPEELSNITDKTRTYIKVLHQYNNTHNSTSAYIKTRGIVIEDNRRYEPLSKWIGSNYTGQHLDKTFTQNLDTAVKENKVFAFVAYTPRGGIGPKDGVAGTYNYKEEWPESWWSGCPVSVIVFDSTEERNNFRDWWYSNKGGLMDFILNKVLAPIFGADAARHVDYIPNLNWQRSWTDKEVLIELGLPEDFLG